MALKVVDPALVGGMGRHELGRFLTPGGRHVWAHGTNPEEGAGDVHVLDPSEGVGRRPLERAIARIDTDEDGS